MSALSNEVIEFLLKKRSEDTFPVFIETGTYLCEALENMSNIFDECHSIELSEYHYQNAVNRFHSRGHVHLHLGDSSDVLGPLCKSISRNCIFYLDGHWSGGTTARGKKKCPLFEELKAINDHLTPQAIIIIDDAHLFGQKEDDEWINMTVENLSNIVKDRLSLSIDLLEAGCGRRWAFYLNNK